MDADDVLSPKRRLLKAVLSGVIVLSALPFFALYLHAMGSTSVLTANLVRVDFAGIANGQDPSRIQVGGVWLASVARLQAGDFTATRKIVLVR